MSDIPADGTRVRAMTYGNEDEEVPPREVRGKLATRYIDVLDYTQCSVDGVLVDPETIREEQ